VSVTDESFSEDFDYVEKVCVLPYPAVVSCLLIAIRCLQFAASPLLFVASCLLSVVFNLFCSQLSPVLY
jgi:hypothetical protein